MKDLLEFLESQKLLVVASVDEHEPWVTNVFYGVDEDGKLYFVSSEDTKHSRQILLHAGVAFSVVWYNPDDRRDRKAVQGKGICRPAKDDAEIRKGVELHNKNFPEFAEHITLEWITQPDNLSKIWVVEPSYMKFWNDALYGDGGTKEFEF